jgi:hypothetical protein
MEARTALPVNSWISSAVVVRDLVDEMGGPQHRAVFDDQSAHVAEDIRS